jgi:hypothetical protein
MIIVPSLMSHALCPLDVSYFKPLKIMFKKEKDETMAREKKMNHSKLHLLDGQNLRPIPNQTYH